MKKCHVSIVKTLKSTKVFSLNCKTINNHIFFKKQLNIFVTLWKNGNETKVYIKILISWGHLKSKIISKY